MSLIVDYSEANEGQVHVCHIKHWQIMDGFAANKMALSNIVSGKYQSMSLVQLSNNSEAVFQKLKDLIDTGYSTQYSFNVYGGRIANDFVEITCKQFRDWVS